MKRRSESSSAPAGAFLRALVVVASVAAGAALAPLANGPGGLPAQEAGAPPVPPEFLEGFRFRLLGPHRGGRVTTVAGVPSEPTTFYFGASGGGVWKTTNGGTSWANVSDGWFEAGSVGAIAVAPSNPQVVYVGTGSAAPRGNVSPGVGVYRSTDGGLTWAHIGLRRAGQIDRIRVHPTDPDIVWVAVLGEIFGPSSERGLYVSRDGGRSWERSLHTSDRTGVVDLAMDARNPEVLFAATWTAERKPWDFIGGPNEGGIFRTRNGGETWTRLSNGLPPDPIGKLAVAVSPADPRRVWAVVEHEPDGGLYRSDDGGDSWTYVNGDRRLRARAWYYTNVYADPVDPGTVYYLGEDMFRSTDGGVTLEVVPVPHVDNHDLWINPDDPRIMIEGNDGGATVTVDGGRTWSTQMNQPTAEIYRVTVDDQFPYRVYGAQQDNSTISLPSRTAGAGITIQHWKVAGGGESGHIAVDPRNPDVVFAGSHGGQISRIDLSTGLERQIMVYPQLHIGMAAGEMRYRFQWNSPIRLSPHDPETLYHTSQHVHRSRDQGQSWETISPDLSRNEAEKQGRAGGPVSHDATSVEFYGTVFAFEESPHVPGELWAGTDDGRIHVLLDDSVGWEEVTPAAMPGEGSTVNMIELSRKEPGRAIVAVHRYRMNDFSPYVFRTTDHGRSWTLLTDGTNGIPADHFVRVVREDPNREGILYAGTEFGLYLSVDDGVRWQPLQLNLPITPITDLAVKNQDLVVATQGRSFWILDDLTPLYQLLDDPGTARPRLFQPSGPYRMRGERAGPDQDMIRDPLHGGWIPTHSAGENPTPGAVFSYWLPWVPEEPVVLEILDAEGRRIRRFTSQPAGLEAWRALPAADAPAYLVDEPEVALPARAGLHRFSWDLRYAAANMVENAFVWGYTGGPTAVPGPYQVRFSVGPWTRTRWFQVRADPRLDIGNEAYQEQFELMLEIRESIAEIQAGVRRIREVLGRESGSGVDAALETILEELMQTRNRYRMDPLNFPPKLLGQLAFLQRQVDGADGTPTAASRERYEELRAQLAEALERLGEALARAVVMP